MRAASGVTRGAGMPSPTGCWRSALAIPPPPAAMPMWRVATPRTMPDFLVGAHALLQCNGLITRDEGFFRDYFKGLKVIVPK